MLRFERLLLADEQSFVPRLTTGADTTGMGDPPPSRPPRRSLVSGSFNDERPFFRVYEGATGHFWRKAAVDRFRHRPIRRSWSDEQASDLLRDYGQLPAIRSDAFSAIMSVAALVLADGIVGMTDASTTRRPAIPCTFRSEPTTASGSRPMRHVLTA